MALQSVSAFKGISDNFAGIVRTSGVNSPANRIEELTPSTFKVNLSREEAIIQGITASTLKGNPANAILFQNLARATLLNEPSITNVLRAQTSSTEQQRFASRFNMDTPDRQLFRMYVNDVVSEVRAPKIEKIETPKFGGAAES